MIVEDVVEVVEAQYTIAGKQVMVEGEEVVGVVEVIQVIEVGKDVQREETKNFIYRFWKKSERLENKLSG